MSSRILTREEVTQKLHDWIGGRVSTDEIQSWATSVYLDDAIDFADWEKEDDSVTKEIVAALDMLDMNLVLPVDAPIYLEFLATPIGDFAAGYAKMKSRFDKVDYSSRRVSLLDVEPYAPFLRAAKKAPNVGGR